MVSDGELLRRYVGVGADVAFTEVVQRHIAVVHRAALRRVGGNAHAADDVTQRVFTDLARKARTLTDRASVAGWLYASVRFAAGDAVRAEQRRRKNEQEAHTMNELNAPDPISWERLAPWLDDVMDRLPERDRDALLLHFFEGRTFPEIGGMLALSADAARMKVNRALEKLRAELGAKGIASSAVALGEVLLTQPAVAAPVPSALAVAAQAMGQAAAVGGGVSLVARWLATVRAAPVWPLAGVAVLGGLAGLGAYSYWTPESATGAAMTSGGVIVSAVAEAEVSPEPVAAPEAAAPANPATGPEAAPKVTKRVVAVTRGPVVEFSQLTTTEKNLLKLLWDHEEAIGHAAGTRWGLTVTEGSENFWRFVTARRALWLSGLVAVGRQKGVTFLTPEGMAFCAAHQKEFAAYPRPKEI